MFNNKNFYIKSIKEVTYYTPDKLKEPNKKNSRIIRGRKCYELIYRISGDIYTSFNNEPIHQLPGTIEYVPKLYNKSYYIKRIKLGESIGIFFDTDVSMPDKNMTFFLSSNKKIQSLFEKMHLLWFNKPDGYYYDCMSLFYTIISELNAFENSYHPKDKFLKIEKGVQYLFENFLNPKIDYYKPAELCNMSYTYFKQIFIQKFEMTPHHYVLSLRLQHGAELLKSKQLSVTTISEMCGYDNVYYFSRKFKEHYGVSPKKYDPSADKTFGLNE